MTLELISFGNHSRAHSALIWQFLFRQVAMSCRTTAQADHTSGKWHSNPCQVSCGWNFCLRVVSPDQKIHRRSHPCWSENPCPGLG